MRTKILIAVIFFSFFIIGCELTQQNEYYHLSSSHRSLLKTGDTLVYMDSKLKTDTFFVFSKISGTYRITLSGSTCQTEPAAYFDIELLYLLKKEGISFDAYCKYIGKSTMFGDCESEYLCDQSILFTVQATDGGKLVSENSTNPVLIWYGHPLKPSGTLIKSMTVLNKNYDNVFYYKSDNIQKTDSIKEIYYTYKNGIIQMNLLNGNVLKLIKK